MSYQLARFLIVLFMSIPVNLLLQMVVEANGIWSGFLVGVVAFMFADIWYGLCGVHDDRS